MIEIFYSDHYIFPLPEGHRFPAEKYSLIRQGLISNNILLTEQLKPANKISKKDLYLAHDPQYVDGFIKGTLEPKKLKKIGITWSPQYVERVLASVGGCFQACSSSLKVGFSGLLAGGTHHAGFDEGEGFCAFNDFAICCLKLLQSNIVKNILIIDLDVHQGNGNASLLKNNPSVTIFCLHSRKNYPFRKVQTPYSISLEENTNDEDYLDCLSKGLNSLKDKSFDLILYQAGVDVLKEDSLGNLSLTMNGVMERDRIVFSFSKDKNIPLALVLGGGYSKPISSTVKAHINTYIVAKEVFKF
ncbi:MAG: histone deacetylase [Halobacteriovoraceae bacterium]|nr:histone deacetylase [Halobacteriovoraceae bacterium]|tara:strand:- start:837 stop:1739 length:903 start_codon:yes stop_codon:yes gene_type:complete